MNSPQHIVIVPDGNRRWAKKKSKPSFMGHRAGAIALQEICKTALELKIPALTIWGCSVSNVTERSSTEVKFLFALFEAYFKKLLKNKDIHKNEVRVEILGRWEELFPAGLKKALQAVVKATEKYSRHRLTFLMAYSGVDEMTHAIREIADVVRKDPDFKVNGTLIKSHLWSKNLPPVDLVIRTGGEPHWSAGLMMWDVAEARLNFTQTLWPDFSPAEFKRAIEEFGGVERRYGK